jgi:hypothetical protein
MKMKAIIENSVSNNGGAIMANIARNGVAAWRRGGHHMYGGVKA